MAMRMGCFMLFVLLVFRMDMFRIFRKKCFGKCRNGITALMPISFLDGFMGRCWMFREVGFEKFKGLQDRAGSSIPG